MSAPHDPDRLAEYDQALLDYQAGLLDGAELRARLLDLGSSFGEDGLWILDLAGGRWRHYDGIGLDRPRSEPDTAVPPGAVTAWRDHLDRVRRPPRSGT